MCGPRSEFGRVLTLATRKQNVEPPAVPQVEAYKPFSPFSVGGEGSTTTPPQQDGLAGDFTQFTDNRQYTPYAKPNSSQGVSAPGTGISYYN